MSNPDHELLNPGNDLLIRGHNLFIYVFSPIASPGLRMLTNLLSSQNAFFVDYFSAFFKIYVSVTCSLMLLTNINLYMS